MFMFLMEKFQVRFQISSLSKSDRFCHFILPFISKGVNSVACYIMIETRQVVSYFSFQVNINSEEGKCHVYTALWFMQAYCGTCYS